MPTADSTKLEAVNEILSSTGNLPAADLLSNRADVLMAIQKLEEVDREIQSKGWWFNREFDVLLQRDSGGEIPLATNVFRVDSPTRTPRPIVSPSAVRTDVTKRGNRVYDLANRTFIFNADVTVDWIIMLDFEDLPETARKYITARAATKYHKQVRGSRELGRLELDEVQALNALQQEEAENGDYNAFENPSIQGVIQNRRRLPRS